MADEEDQKDHENFEELLRWLDPDRDEAGRKYQHIRERLIKIFTWRHCTNIEELADEVIDRVAKKVREISKEYSGDVTRYFYGVAQHVAQENMRDQAKFLELQEAKKISVPDDPENDDSIADDSLSYCLEQLNERDRELILAYYRYDQPLKKACHRRLADELGITMNALWIRVSRIRSLLERCLEKRRRQDGPVQ